LFGFAASKLDVKAGVSGLLRPKRSIAATVARSYDELFGRARLQGLPDAPRFVFCATNMGSGSLVRFAKPYTARSPRPRPEHGCRGVGGVSTGPLADGHHPR
jgi:NTE family protein